MATDKLPPLAARAQLVNQDRTGTTVLLRFLQDVLDRLKSPIDGIIDGDIPAGDVTPGSIDIDDLVDAFRRDVGVLTGLDGTQTIRERVADLRNEVEELAQATAQTGGSFNIWRVEVDAAFGGSIASIESTLLALADADEAFALQLTTLETTFTNNYNTATAAIATEASTRSTADSALAVVDTSLATSFNDVSAGGMARFEVATTASGAVASYKTALRVTVGSTTYSGGMRLDLRNLGGGSYDVRAFFDVGQFVIGNSSLNYAPFFVSGGVVYIQSAVVQDLIVSNFRLKGSGGYVGIDADTIVQNETLVTALIAANAASKSDIYSNSGSVDVSAGTGSVNVAQKFATPQGGTGSRVSVTFTANLYATSNGANNWGSFIGRLYRNSVDTGAYCVARPDDENQDGLLIINYVDESPGTSTIQWDVIVVYITSPGPGVNISCRGRYLKVENSKK